MRAPDSYCLGKVKAIASASTNETPAVPANMRLFLHRSQALLIQFGACLPGTGFTASEDGS